MAIYVPGKGTAALALIECQADECLIEGPAGTGKTRALLCKCHMLCGDNPNSRILVVRKTRKSLTQSALVTFEDHVLDDYWRKALGVMRPTRAHRAEYTYRNGARIIVAGLDDPARIMSTEYDFIAAFEATELTENDFETLTTRLRHGKTPRQQIHADCNPGAPTHWLNRRASTDKMVRLLSRHEDNPLLYNSSRKRWTKVGKAYIEKLDALTGVRKLRLRNGLWAAAEGMVYGDDYDAAIHLIDSFTIPDDWRKFWAVDFGTVHPFVAQLWAVDGDGRMYRIAEVYHTGRLVSEHAETMRGIAPPEAVETCVCDHQLQERMELEKAGYHTTAADKDHATGFQAVRAHLKLGIDDRPRMQFFRDAVSERDQGLHDSSRPCCTEEEFDGYVHKVRSDGTKTEDVVKERDDGMDAMRYAAKYVDEGDLGEVYIAEDTHTIRRPTVRF